MKILLVSATGFEVLPLLPEHTSADLPAGSLLNIDINETTIDLLITGVGLPLAAYHLGKHFARHQYDLAIQAGVAGSFDRQIALGTVVQVHSDTFADLCVEEADGQTTSMFDMGLVPKDDFPFQHGWLTNPDPVMDFLPAVKGISVNRVHGCEASIQVIQQRYPEAVAESMEGAAFFYACLLAQQKFLAIRAISNYVEPRNRDAWELGLAIERLNVTLKEMLTLMLKPSAP